VPENQLDFPFHIDLPRAIVWDALVDQDLVEGWLALAEIEPRLGGRYDLTWRSGKPVPQLPGVITAFEPVSNLRIDTGAGGIIDFTLTEMMGGTRQTSTWLVVHLVVDADPRMLASTIAHWRCNLDQLEELLRGHPVVWETWAEVRGPEWNRYLREAQAED
jgi:uncharacterized protein YndB with AHSA1/START domain